VRNDLRFTPRHALSIVEAPPSVNPASPVDAAEDFW
jgi:hypothetical protein